MAAHARHGSTIGMGHDAGNGGPVQPRAPPLPHISDLLAVPKNVDPNQSIKKLLEMAETSLRQSEMSRDFNRPALALKDYVRASVIAIQYIRDNRDYPFLKDHPDLAAAHNSLLKRISQQDEIYAKIKQNVIADNKKTGVQPSGQGSARAPLSTEGTPRTSTSSFTSEGSKSQRLPNGSALNGAHTNGAVVNGIHVNGSPARTKPIVHPKPQALHGNAIKSSEGRPFSLPNGGVQDLAARFANLRGPQVSPGQDPRIKTHAIVPPKPYGPRDMPPPQKPKLSIESSIPTLPKMPDAIYSPARGNVTGEASRLPTSTPRGLFTRTGSSTSLSSTPNASRSSLSNDYFSPAPGIPEAQPARSSSELALKIPPGDTITAEQLFQSMRSKASILIIDIRIREDFDEGHIMSSSIICIEPSILIRENISADAISETMVLSPNQEQTLFDRRDKYDLVVFYDQDSESIPTSPRDSDDLVIISLHRALVHLNYGHDLRNPPKILKGGLDAWIDLMGPASLKSTSVAGHNPPQPRQSRKVGIERRRSKFLVKPLQPDEVEAWQETLKNDDIETASSPNFLRTTEDFLRRFPPVGAEQQSMTSPVAAKQSPMYGLSHQVDLYSDLPSPPTRPAPALPRQSHSGLSHEVDVHQQQEPGPLVQKSTGRSVKSVEHHPAAGDGIKHFTGLNNPHNWCYANSTLQSLLGSPDFGRELADSEWATKYEAPTKDNEKTNPQLMIRIISNLFHWMSTGKFQVMKAQTLMDYSRQRCTKSRSFEQFGGTQQQDAQEFMSFVLTHLHDETNTRRNRKGQVAQPDTKTQSLLQAAAEYWRNHLEYNQSIVDRYWRGIELSKVQCLECRTNTYHFTAFELILVTVNLGRSMTLEQALIQHTADNTLDDFSCDQCHRPTRAMQSLSFARLPPLLCIVFRRFHYQQSTADLRKSTAPITWDFNDCDLSPYFLNQNDCAQAGEVSDRGFTGPFRYECYAVVVHSGSRTDNGHYYAYVRDSSTHDPYAWFCCDDSRVTRVRIGSGDRDDVQERVFKSGRDCVPYLVFFRRKGTH